MSADGDLVMESYLQATFEITLRGRRMSFADSGQPSVLGSRDTPENTVLLLHGLSREGGAQWTAAFEQLRRTHRVVVPDFPGFGRSMSGPRDVAQLAETTVDLLAALGLGRVSLVGHSLGAAVALVIASERPEFVSKAVYFALPCYPRELSWSERAASTRWPGATLLRAAFGKQAMRRYDMDSADASKTLPAFPESAYEWIRPLAKPQTLQARLPRIRSKSLILWGRDDLVSPCTHGLRLARELAGARLELLECGHWPRPQEQKPLLDALQSFLD